MGMPAAKRGDQIVAIDTHLIQPTGPVSPIPVPHPFSGPIDGGLSGSVTIDGQPAATVGSTARCTHTPIGGMFVVPPQNQGEVAVGSSTVRINGKAAARAGDQVRTCNDPVPLPVGTIIAASTVTIGG